MDLDFSCLDALPGLECKDIAQAEQDLPSWILSDNNESLDFQLMAKEAHSPLIQTNASPEYILAEGSPYDRDLLANCDQDIPNLNDYLCEPDRKRFLVEDLMHGNLSWTPDTPSTSDLPELDDIIQDADNVLLGPSSASSPEQIKQNGDQLPLLEMYTPDQSPDNSDGQFQAPTNQPQPEPMQVEYQEERELIPPSTGYIQYPQQPSTTPVLFQNPEAQQPINQVQDQAYSPIYFNTISSALPEVSSDLISANGMKEDVLPQSQAINEEPVEFKPQIVPSVDASALPQIISVPISEASYPQLPQINLVSSPTVATSQPSFRTINVVSPPSHLSTYSQAEEVGPSNPLPRILKVIPSGPTNQAPKRIVINLKKVVARSRSPSVQPKIETSQPTLKDIFNGENDELLKQVDNLVKNDDIAEESFKQQRPSTSFGGAISPSQSAVSEAVIPPSYVVNQLDPSTTRFRSLKRSGENSTASSSSSTSEIAKKSKSGKKTTVRRVPFSLDEKKSRKMEQNKRAALRYRMKKREEEEQAQASLQEMENENDKLRVKADSVEAEVKMMRKLVSDMLLARIQKRLAN